MGVLEAICRRGGTPCGQAKVAREAGLANNTVAAGYLELLMDLMCAGAAVPWDPERDVPVRRNPAKFPFTNLLAAVCWHPDHPVSLRDFAALSPQTQGVWYEWAVAQELWRRRVVGGEDFPENMLFRQAGGHEIDFADRPDLLIEVERGRASALDLAWFRTSFPESGSW